MHPSDQNRPFLVVDPSAPPSAARFAEIVARSLATISARQLAIFEQVLALRAEKTGRPIDAIREEALEAQRNHFRQEIDWWRTYLGHEMSEDE